MNGLAAGLTGTQRWAKWAALLAALLFPLAAGAQAGPGDVPAASVLLLATQVPASQVQASEIPESALSGAQLRLLGRTVEQIHLPVTSSAMKAGELMEKIPLKIGDRLDRNNVRESLRVLFATGNFAMIETEVTLLPTGGLLVNFRTKPNYFNGSVTVTGLPKVGPSETQVVNTGRLELGTLFTEENLEDSESRILHLLHDNGYWKAQVEAKLDRHEQTQQVDVEFHIAAGEVAHVGTLTVLGDPDLSAAEAEDICKLRPGTRVRGNLLQHAVARLRKRYVKQHRLSAQLSAGVPIFHAESNTVDYTFKVERGPVVDIRAEGMELSRAKLKRYVPVYEEHAVDEDLIDEGQRNLRDYLQGQGFFDAEVEVRQDEETQLDTRLETQHIVYSIQPGRQHKLRAIELEGNKRFDVATLRERMGTQIANMFQPHGHYSQAILANDLQVIKNLYRANGYESVQVTSEVLDDYDGTHGDMKIVVKVDEGPLVLVGALEIRGAKAIRESELHSLINTQAGQPFSEATVAEDREVVLNYYFNRGFPSVQLESSAKFADAAHTRMDVVYELHEGAQEFVNRVLISGVVHTMPHIVNRAVVIREGAPLSQEKMLLTQRNLYDLGIFNEVQTAVENPEGDEKYKDVLFHIKEARRWTVNYGFGMEIGTGLNTEQGGSPQGETGVSPRVVLDVTRINFRGRDESLIFKSHFGNLEKRASLSFDQPKWFDLPNWRMTLTALYDNERDITTFTSNRLEGSIQLTEHATRATQLLYRFAYRRIKVDPGSFPAGFSPDLIQIYSEPVRVGMPSLIYLRDTRDDPVNSTKGTYNTFDIGVASGYFGSQANFGRVLAQNATYYKFHKSWVFARSLRIGVETPYGSLGYIPLPEHYFVGGSNSHRGFAINQAGPRDPYSGAPLGGNAMLVNNLELRMPPVPLPYVKDNLSLVLFDDIGNAFGTANQMWKNVVRFKQRDPQSCRTLPSTSCDFSYMSQAAGAGLRYRTPIGPVRIDLGYNLNPPVFPVNQPSGGAAYSEQVRHFNYFFSIGQTF
ncbi:MAG: POTRA domain-containing protein [Candidatus Korobacteraceae bacterium]